MGLKGNNYDIDKIYEYFINEFGGDIPDYQLWTDNCTTKVKEALEAGNYMNSNISIDMPLLLRNEIMMQELKNKFIGNNINKGIKQKK